ncbi:hypothetical protein NKH18_18800 [Streptomyces sp. M10(2022)]
MGARATVVAGCGLALLLAVVAGLLFSVLPRWKARRSRVVPLESVDQGGELLALLGELGAVTGVVPMPGWWSIPQPLRSARWCSAVTAAPWCACTVGCSPSGAAIPSASGRCCCTSSPMSPTGTSP